MLDPFQSYGYGSLGFEVGEYVDSARLICLKANFHLQLVVKTSSSVSRWYHRQDVACYLSR